MPRTIVTIPARSTEAQADLTLPGIQKKKVAAYARVSTDSEEQQTSYVQQIRYYRSFIESNPDWDFVEVYTDEGISGTSTKHRNGFKTMIADALSGKIDLIITKSVSRFARNTVDSLTNIRKLKEAGVEVYFEKENIYTFDSKGEVMLTIMASLAQEESRSISENVTWGQRKRFSDGKASVAFSNFLGYDRGPNGEFVINPEQAKVVKRIFVLFLEGATYHHICTVLNNDGIPTPSGKSQWRVATIQSILQNEKYRGDALLQKNYTVDYLTKKMKKNEGEIPQYYVEGNHDAIIEPEVFELVQEEIQKRKAEDKRVCNSPITKKLKCAECGHWFGRKLWHSTDAGRKYVWRCNNKYKKKPNCKTPHLVEDEVKSAFLQAVNQLLSQSSALLNTFERVTRQALATEPLEARLEEAEQQKALLLEQGQKLLNESPQRAQTAEGFSEKYADILARFQRSQQECEELENEINRRKTALYNTGEFLKAIETMEPITEFDDRLWNRLLDYATVSENKEICFKFKDGTEITIAA